MNCPNCNFKFNKHPFEYYYFKVELGNTTLYYDICPNCNEIYWFLFENKGTLIYENINS